MKQLVNESSNEIIKYLTRQRNKERTNELIKERRRK